MDVVTKHISEIKESSIPNPMYGKTIYFFKESVKPQIERNQLLGYLGAFAGTSTDLSSEVDICVIPHASYLKLKDEKSDIVITTINEKLNAYDEEKDRYSNKIPNTLIVPERHFFKFIKDHLLENDQVKIDQFKQIDFTYQV